MYYMKTTTSIKLDTKIKKEATKLAHELGLTLSSVINASLTQFVKEKKLTLQAHPPFKPKVEKELLKAIKDIKEGNMKDFVGPFDNFEDLKKSLLG